MDMVTIGNLLERAKFKDGGLWVNITEDWLQGRTTYGGLSTLLAYLAAKSTQPDLPPLRSAQISFIGPLNGEIEAKANIIRRGKSSAFVEVKIYSSEGLGYIANFLFGTDRPLSVKYEDFDPPEFVNPEIAVIPNLKFQIPTFARHFEMRYALSENTGKRPEIWRWARLDDYSGLDEFGSLLIMADSLPPAAIPMLRGRAQSSINWYFNILTTKPKTENGWWLMNSKAQNIENGYSSQEMKIWNTKGEPIMSGMQIFAIYE